MNASPTHHRQLYRHSFALYRQPTYPPKGGNGVGGHHRQPPTFAPTPGGPARAPLAGAPCAGSAMPGRAKGNPRNLRSPRSCLPILRGRRPPFSEGYSSVGTTAITAPPCAFARLRAFSSIRGPSHTMRAPCSSASGSARMLSEGRSPASERNASLFTESLKRASSRRSSFIKTGYHHAQARGRVAQGGHRILETGALLTAPPKSWRARRLERGGTTASDRGVAESLGASPGTTGRPFACTPAGFALGGGDAEFIEIVGFQISLSHRAPAS